MKDWGIKALKFIGASLGVLVSAWVMGFSSSTTLFHLFKTERVEAESRVRQAIIETENKMMAIRGADMDGLRVQIDILARGQNTLIIQNSEIIRRLR